MTSNHPSPSNENRVFETPERTGRPETETEKVNREEARLPNNGEAPEYSEDEDASSMPDVDKIDR